MAQQLDVSESLPQDFEILAKRRFLLAIEGIDSFLVKTAALPTMTTEEVAIPFLNSMRYLAGRQTFNTMTVTLHSAIAPSAMQEVMEWSRLCNEVVSGRAGYAAFYKRAIQIKMLDPLLTVVQLWDYKGAFITEANFGELTYEGSDPAEISLTIRFDTCTPLF